MQIVLIRHGDAAKHSPTGEDRGRMLSMRGREESRLVGEELAKRGIRPDRLLTSPLERCLRTAELAGEALAVLPIPDERLAAEKPLGPVVELIKEFGADEEHRCLALCGHNPRISELAALLEHGPGRPRDMVALATGEALVLEIDRNEPVGTGRVVERVEAGLLDRA